MATHKPTTPSKPAPKPAPRPVEQEDYEPVTPPPAQPVQPPQPAAAPTVQVPKHGLSDEQVSYIKSLFANRELKYLGCEASAGALNISAAKGDFARGATVHDRFDCLKQAHVSDDFKTLVAQTMTTLLQHF